MQNGIALCFVHLGCDARGGSQGGGDGGKDGNDEVDDFLDDFFLVHGCRMVKWLVSFCNWSPPYEGG